jgi:hypothetical protein
MVVALGAPSVDSGSRCVIGVRPEEGSHSPLQAKASGLFRPAGALHLAVSSEAARPAPTTAKHNRGAAGGRVQRRRVFGTGSRDPRYIHTRHLRDQGLEPEFIGPHRGGPAGPMPRRYVNGRFLIGRGHGAWLLDMNAAGSRERSAVGSGCEDEVTPASIWQQRTGACVSERVAHRGAGAGCARLDVGQDDTEARARCGSAAKITGHAIGPGDTTSPHHSGARVWAVSRVQAHACSPGSPSGS